MTTYHPNSSSRGFTLIELLVVIAIIGILAAVILAALNAARSKGGDGAIKSNLGTVRTQATLYRDDNNNAFGTNVAAAGPTPAACTTANTLFTDPNIAAAIFAADKAAGGDGSPQNITCAIDADGAAWVVYAPLTNVSAPNTGWCIDSEGLAKADTAPAGFACP
jgi:prepilin-type N-terminal cleavage/methylation domain-containing protein